MSIKVKEYNYGEGYFPKLFIKDGKIVDAKCKCVWSQIHPNAFKEGGRLCKHLISSIIEYGLELKNKQKRNRLDQKGYVLIYKPDHKYSETKKGWIYEHRAKVEDFIKQALKKGECIHHIDENKQNNKINNLMIFKSHSEHSKFHTKIKQFGMTNPVLRQIENRWENIK